MSGHSKWSTIKHKKGAADAKRGKIFTKLIKEITMSSRIGGGDINANPRLRTAVDKAKAANLPKDTMDRAIKKGTGELSGVNYEEMVYEGYGPEGVAIIMEITTDNKNRTAAEIRKILSRRNGSLGSTNCVAWMFEKKGIINIDTGQIAEDDLMEIVLEAGAEDLQKYGDTYEVLTPPDAFSEVLAVLREKNIEVENSEVSRVQTSGESIKVKNNDKSEQIMSLLEELEEQDDVSSVSSNFEMDED
ncbi:MAG: YebC/PmpR family DNA-binding transcriptional regulator [Spirochaetes bacterium]|nr:YebC/PmpR family DNA-binding transcriptional regulator [Spirochaetota bacterium]